MKNDERNKMTFPQLWETLTIREAALVRKNTREGLRKPNPDTWRPTFWRWYTGKQIPESYGERVLFASIINETLGMNTDADTLFPEKTEK